MIYVAEIITVAFIYAGFRATGRSFVWGWWGGATAMFAMHILERLLP